MARAVVLAAAAMAAACGGERGPGSPSAPRPTPMPAGLASGAVLSIVAAGSGAVVAGANVVIGGHVHVSDSAGQVTVAAAALPGAFVDATAAGFLDRQTLVRSRPDPRLALWPLTTASGIDEAYTAAIVYTSAAVGGGPAGGSAMQRLPPDATQIVIVPSAEILDDSAAHAFHADAVARINAAARGAVTYALARERPPTGVVFDALLRPSESLCTSGQARGFARLSLRGSEINGGEIVYCSSDVARSGTVVHEVGHTFGLRHSNDSREVMFGGFARGRRVEFSAREADVMALMLERPAGNRFPDSDRDVTGLSTGEAVIVCR